MLDISSRSWKAPLPCRRGASWNGRAYPSIICPPTADRFSQARALSRARLLPVDPRRPAPRHGLSHVFSLIGGSRWEPPCMRSPARNGSPRSLGAAPRQGVLEA